ncbi:MAG: transcriptional regulator [Verrucomicrobiales bacterium]|nr:transcriptional regulator [Verrucomicrobiales bacterium]
MKQRVHHRFSCPMPSKKDLDAKSLEKIAALFKVFAEPTRLAILQLLRRGPHSVNEIVEALPTSQANVSKQLRLLYDADLLSREQRGNQVIYSVHEPLVYELCELVCDKLNRQAKSEGAVVYEI